MQYSLKEGVSITHFDGVVGLFVVGRSTAIEHGQFTNGIRSIVEIELIGLNVGQVDGNQFSHIRCAQAEDLCETR